MKSYSYLVNKYFKVHKKRALLTILGIISSIILFFTIGYLNNYIKDIKTEDEKVLRGNYDVAIYDVDKEIIENITNNIKVDKSGLYKFESQTSLNLGNTQKNISIYKLDSIAINNIFNQSIDMKEGEVPKKQNELALDYILKNKLNLNLKDTITINNTKYTIVGFYQEIIEISPNSLSGFTYLDKNNIDDNVNIAFRIKDSDNKLKNIESILRDSGVEFNSIVGSENISLNYYLLDNAIYRDYYGNFNLDEELVIQAILNLVVLILTIILTYGSINVSLNERKKQFAILRCIGATPSKIKILLIKESIMLLIFSLIPGIILAQIVSWIITELLSITGVYTTYTHMKNKVYLDVVINTTLLIILNTFFATIIPLIKVGKLSPIEVIKSKVDENKNIRNRNSKIIKRLFGYIGELAYKNIRVNNKRFIITISTLTTILVVIIGFGGYKRIDNKYSKLKADELTDIRITFYPSINDENDINMNEKRNIENQQFINGLEKLNVSNEEIYSGIRFINKAILQGVSINKNAQKDSEIEDIKLDKKDSVYSNSMVLLVLDDKSINEILPNVESKKGRIDKFDQNDFVVIKTSRNKNILKYENISPLEINNDEVNLYLLTHNTKNIDKVNPIKMNYLGEIDPNKIINSSKYGYDNLLAVIVNNEFYKNNINNIEDDFGVLLNVSLNIDKTKDYNEMITKIDEYVNLSNAYFSQDKLEELEYIEGRNVFFMIIYLGLFLIIIMASINLINTRNIDIYLREKEFKILLSIGMKKSDLKKMIFLEGIISWFISCSIGNIISIIILIGINVIYVYYQGHIKNIYIPYEVIFISNLILFIITIITSSIPYKKFKNIDLNDLTNEKD